MNGAMLSPAAASPAFGYAEYGPEWFIWNVPYFGYAWLGVPDPLWMHRHHLHRMHTARNLGGRAPALARATPDTAKLGPHSPHAQSRPQVRTAERSATRGPAMSVRGNHQVNRGGPQHGASVASARPVQPARSSGITNGRAGVSTMPNVTTPSHGGSGIIYSHPQGMPPHGGSGGHPLIGFPGGHMGGWNFNHFPMNSSPGMHHFGGFNGGFNGGMHGGGSGGGMMIGGHGGGHR